MPISSFIDYIRLEKRYSKHTSVAYQKDLEDLENYLSKNHPTLSLTTIGTKQLRGYIMHLSANGQNEKTVNRKLSTFKSFYKFLLKIGEVETSPVQNITGLKQSKQVQTVFTPEEMETLLDNDDFFENDFEGVRNRLIIEMLYQTGMRRAELINLKLQGIDFAQSQMIVLGKRNKERIIPLTTHFLEKINNYVNLATTEGLDLSNSFFITLSNKKLYPKLVYNVVNSYLSIVSSKAKKSPHMLRHSLATHLVSKGADLNSVKELLGHSSLASTQVYTHNDIQQLKNVFNQAHPRGEFSK